MSPSNCFRLSGSGFVVCVVVTGVAVSVLKVVSSLMLEVVLVNGSAACDEIDVCVWMLSRVPLI